MEIEKVEEILAGDAPITRAEWERAMRAACDLHRISGSGYMGSDSVRRKRMESVLRSQPSHEMVSAHCGSHPDEHAWGVRAVRTLSPAQRRVLTRLIAGPLGGVLVTT